MGTVVAAGTGRVPRPKPERWSTSVKGIVFHDILLHTEKPPYRFSHTATANLFAEQVAVRAGAGPASAPEHHPLCGRQEDSPGEYDIPDDLPNLRTGHGHGFYPAAVRPSPAMPLSAPTARSLSHAL